MNPNNQTPPTADEIALSLVKMLFWGAMFAACIEAAIKWLNL